MTLLQILPLSLSVACHVHHAWRLLIPLAVWWRHPAVTWMDVLQLSAWDISRLHLPDKPAGPKMADTVRSSHSCRRNAPFFWLVFRGILWQCRASYPDGRQTALETKRLLHPERMQEVSGHYNDASRPNEFIDMPSLPWLSELFCSETLNAMCMS